ncbi:hypothetical protein MNEG_4932 [Monoraphidium neglectum]|uniref:Uncharacterized protein n=1 Tax=Monoraphidium neglectum TaxID=145388 RepID=A0A0D2MRE8_9CHLO|nr:hypothetical protein MNEG_4932 [Monoraphidium neglectum]KIZ03032.1 hypothetical protein MNEG_4932 [Monoraphidium neglectum]|eukprot:XP_013902051.1 hypothetical protein MNEG_4932 [Monoraphidium neglectum]
MSPLHAAPRCPAAAALLAEGDGGGEGGVGNGEAGAGTGWADLLSVADLDVLEAVRSAADRLLPLVARGGGGGGGDGGAAACSDGPARLDARALLAVAVVLQEAARDASAAAETRGGIVAP